MPSPLGNWNRLREKRLGILLHYDDSTSDAGALEWLMHDPACHVSYNIIVCDSLKSGGVVQVTPEEARAWHAGVSQPSNPKLVYRDANSAFYGIAIAANAKDKPTPYQLRQVVRICRRLFAKNGWPLTDTWRISEHRLEAWPRGRKVDTGAVMPAELIRSLLATEPAAE